MSCVVLYHDDGHGMRQVFRAIEKRPCISVEILVPLDAAQGQGGAYLEPCTMDGWTS